MSMTEYSPEKDYLASIRASYAINAMGELWYAMTQLAQRYIKQDWTQTASDILAFVVLQDDVPQDTHEQAEEFFDNLERSICPRVIWDAKEFASDMDLVGMVDYLLDNNPS
jgi:hypothetical protein